MLDGKDVLSFKSEDSSIKRGPLDISVLNREWWSSNVCFACASASRERTGSDSGCSDRGTLQWHSVHLHQRRRSLQRPATILPLTTTCSGRNRAAMATPAHIWHLCSHPVNVFMGHKMAGDKALAGCSCGLMYDADAAEFLFENLLWHLVKYAYLFFC